MTRKEEPAPRPVEAGHAKTAAHGKAQGKETSPSSKAKAGRGKEELESLRKRLENETRRVEELQTSLVRLQADFENYRKRSAKEKAENQRFANEKLILDVVDILANFERAVEASSGNDSLHEGIGLILKQFRNLLAREGVERIEAEGARFDPNLHEAVMREETMSFEPGVVIQEFEKGWTLHGKVIRPAKVKVAARGEANG
ncbi:MAG: nucleotide exchange factor GrpE [Euryarchaeota archaeon]|nr:nucleotide exchange factor GrpE [Euryarchaeota archaeon]